MISFTCPNCQAKLNAKDKLAGQTRDCPKCGEPVTVPQAGLSTEVSEEDWPGLDDVAPDQHVEKVAEEGLPRFEPPKHLVPSHRYLICDRARLFAVWESGGQGWMIKTNVGLLSAKRNPDQLPSQGHYTLVELVMETTDEGLRLRGIDTYELAERWALTTLEQDDHRILSKAVGPGRLNRDQKAAVHEFLREHFMRDVWESAREVLDFLTSPDDRPESIERRT
jgi:hypothetical protein